MPFQIIRNDITKVKADAIVNSANPDAIYAMGTDEAIYRAAGEEELLKEREKIGKIEVGECAATHAFALDAKYIIHTVGPDWIDGSHGEKIALRSCYISSLKRAEELGCESIAFPLISTGVYRFPKDEALRIARESIAEFLTNSDMMVYLVVYSKEAYELSRELTTEIDSYIDDHYVKAKAEEQLLQHKADIEDLIEELDELFKKEDSRRHKQCAGDLIDEKTVSNNAVAPKKQALNAKPGFSQSDLAGLVGGISATFQEKLFAYISEKDMSNVDVYKRANMDKKLFSKIQCNKDYVPKKSTALALAIALKLTMEETTDLLQRAGYALSPASKSDVIVSYFIVNNRYDIYEINCTLFDYSLPTL